MIGTTLVLFLSGCLFGLGGILLAHIAIEDKDRTVGFSSVVAIILSLCCFYNTWEALIWTLNN